MRVHNKKSLKLIRRELRQSSTFAESVLWERLRGRKLDGLKFNRQHSIGNYIVDFYCASKKLIIELDGAVHESADQKEKDEFRDEILKDMGFMILRFKNAQIINEFELVKEKILNSISN